MKRLALLAAVLLASCSEDASAPYMQIVGGGFVFNYRIADAYYGFVARPKRTLPEGGELEVLFELPGGGPPFVVREPVKQGQIQYAFKTVSLRHVMKDHPYKATLRVLDGSGKELARYERSFISDIDQDTLPQKPLVTGPGYQPAEP
jgi:hypothetical protein